MMELSAKNLYQLFEQHKSIVNPFAAVCQCRHETSYQGQPWNSELCLKANNLAGLKQWAGWSGAVYAKSSWEQSPDGQKAERVSNFCRYPSVADFVRNYVAKIERDYPLCAASADNFWGYFSGLFRGRLGAWATDLAYLERMIDQVLVLGPVFFGDACPAKCRSALAFAAAAGRLLPEHEKRIWQRLNKAFGESETPNRTGTGGARTTTRPQQPTAERSRLICIDPGHGNPDPGAVGLAGTREADVVLAVAKHLAPELEALGYRVVLTRSGSGRIDPDRSVDLNKRVEVANQAAADCFVSLHANAAQNRSACGVEVCKYPGSAAAALLGAEICSVLSGMLNLRNRGLKDRADLYVLRHTRMPAVLVELAFLSNPTEELLLRDDEWRRAAAEAIAGAVDRYFREGAGA